jgi:hypothetical protein
MPPRGSRRKRSFAARRALHAGCADDQRRVSEDRRTRRQGGVALAGCCRGGRRGMEADHRRGGVWASAGPGGALARWGVVKGDRVALVSENRWEWPVTDFAALALGAVDVPLYMTLTAEQVGYMLRDSGAKVAVVSSGAGTRRCARQATLPALEHVVVMDEATPQSPDPGHPFPVLSFADLMPARLRCRRAMRSSTHACGGEAGGPGDDYLHLGHHRRAQGCDADPWQPGQQLHASPPSPSGSPKRTAASRFCRSRM